LQSEHERWLTEKKIGRPAFVIDYPKQIKAFYMRQNDDGRTVAAMDLLVPGVGEIIGGSQREEREDVLRARMTELGLSAEEYWWYLELRKFGGVPHSGFGLGFDRALMYVTGMTNIRDVQPFPRTPGHVEF
jgi:asparaginyl-tRNA synthetase